MIKTLKSFLNSRDSQPWWEFSRIQASDDGFEAFWGDRRVESVRWSEVLRIFTYKVDCFAFDVIVLAFELRGRQEVLEVSEEVEGFRELISAMDKAFPKGNPEWYFNLMQPAFAWNPTLLFEREG